MSPKRHQGAHYQDGHVRYWSAVSKAETKAGDADSALPLHMRDERGRSPKTA